MNAHYDTFAALHVFCFGLHQRQFGIEQHNNHYCDPMMHGRRSRIRHSRKRLSSDCPTDKQNKLLFAAGCGSLCKHRSIRCRGQPTLLTETVYFSYLLAQLLVDIGVYVAGSKHSIWIDLIIRFRLQPGGLMHRE